MKRRDIQKGKTFINRGKGNTSRTVVDIGDENKPKVYFNRNGKNPRKNDTGVLYQQTIRGMLVHRKLYLSSFLKWCGKEIPTATIQIQEQMKV